MSKIGSRQSASTIVAIAAGRHGAKTFVADRFGQLGGNIGPGHWGGGSTLLPRMSQ